MIRVDRRGRRFINESLPYDAVSKSLDYFDAGAREYPRDPCWFLFDESARLAGPAGLPNPIGEPIYPWSADNSEEIAKGWILKAESLSELGEKMEVDATALEETLPSPPIPTPDQLEQKDPVPKHSIGASDH